MPLRLFHSTTFLAGYGKCMHYRLVADDLLDSSFLLVSTIYNSGKMDLGSPPAPHSP